MKISIVHDHLTQEGGAEKVLRVIQDIWPNVPTYTLIYDKKKVGDLYKNREIKTSFLQKIPGAVRHHKWFLPLMPTATESYDLSEYDIVISSCSALSKGVITHPHTLHICFCHTPTRYLWSDTHRYIEELNFPKVVKKITPYILSRLRLWDQLAAQRVDVFVANSKFISDRIKKYYRRNSVILYPPVDSKKFYISDSTENYYLTGGRLVSYKRFDIVIQAFNRLGIKLFVFGEGPEFEKLRKMSKPHIQFLGWLNENDLSRLYSRCIAFIHPQIEDFGITAIESMACGRPVIAFGEGGASETIVDNFTGKFFDEQTWEALADTVARFDPEKYSPLKIKEYSSQFDTEIFKRKFFNLVENEYKKINEF